MAHQFDEKEMPEGLTVDTDQALYVYKNYNDQVKAMREEARARLKMPNWHVKEDFVISGISGKFPESDNIKEFEHNLYNNIDMVVEDERRWPFGYLGLPKGSGKIKDIGLFDHKFFHIDERDAHYLDSQLRIMLEIVFEALWDAGIDPNSLAGTNTGVFMGNSFDEYLSAYSQDYMTVPAYKQCFFGLLSNIYDLKGPSKIYDTACASGLSAMHEAIVSLRSGQCDRAIVLGINISLRALTQSQFLILNMISPDGHCKCLDDDANGYAKGEACVAVIVQRESEAKRIHAKIVHSKSNCDGYKDMGITYPSFELQRELIEDTYREALIDPLDIGFCEAHCTGTKAGDPSEMRAIQESMCVGRTEPLLIGAIKSNIGHTEAASGLCSLVKSILCFEKEIIPANLHMTKINHQIEGLVSGILKPVVVNTPYTGQYVGLNCFGFGGVNVHVLIQKHLEDMKRQQASEEAYPRLITFCGRTKQTLDNTNSFLVENPDNVTQDFLALLNDVSTTSAWPNRKFKGMRYRGYVIFDRKAKAFTELKDNKIRAKTRPPVCYVFTGMGCQWTAMGEGLYQFQVMAKTLDKCAQTLKSIDSSMDLKKLLTEKEPTLLQSSLNSFVAIAAVQMALVDFLESMGVEPDHIVGHSIGELTCAYADKCLTVEQCIAAAYWRGKIVEEKLADTGAMAAIGGSWTETQELISKHGDANVHLACNNSNDSVTVSGPKDSIDKFLAQLQEHEPNIFARVVNSTGRAFHTPQVEVISSTLLEKLNKQVGAATGSKTCRWLSSTYDNDETPFSNTYLVDNLIKPVLFFEALQKVPSEAVFIEVAPHNLLQSIVKRVQMERGNKNVSFVSTMSRQPNGEIGNINSVLKCLGEIYNCGLDPKIGSLYPKVQYPVARTTPHLHSLITWKHDRQFTVTQYPHFFNQEKMFDAIKSFDLQMKEDKFIADHCIDGRVLFPATAYLHLIWVYVSKMFNTEFDKFPIVFENVSLHRATIMPKMGIVNFEIRFNNGSGKFVIMESAMLTASGTIRIPQDASNFLQHQQHLDKLEEFEGKEFMLEMKTKDIYKEFRLRGYDYGPEFQVIDHIRAHDNKIWAKINFKNWVTFLDGMIQMAVIGRPIRGLYLPVRINSFKVDPRQIALPEGDDASFITVDCLFDGHLNLGVARGVEYQGIKANLAPRKIHNVAPIEEVFEFVPHDEKNIPCCTSRAMSDERAEEREKQLRKYQQDCVQLYSGAQQEENLYEKDSEAIFFKLLKQIKLNEVELKEKTLEGIEEDLLFQTYLNERFLRSQLELVGENVLELNLNILEVNQSNLLLAPKILTWLVLSTFKVNFSYNLLHSAPERLNQSKLEVIQATHNWQAEKSKFPSDLINLDLVVYKDSSLCPLTSPFKINFELLLESLWNALGDNRFAIILLRDKVFPAEELLLKALEKEVPTGSRLEELFAALKESKLKLIGHKSEVFGVNCILLRKVPYDVLPQDQIFLPISNNPSEWFEELQLKVREIAESEVASKSIWLLANEPSNGVIGLVSCLHKEPLGGKVRCILNKDKTVKLDADSEWVTNTIKLNLYTNVISDGKLGTMRHFTLPTEDLEPVSTQHCYLNVITRGDLSSLRWFESQHKFWPVNKRAGEALCTIYYAPLNFRDIMLATGKLPPDALPDDMGLDDCILGLEFAGRDEKGKRVMGMVPSKGLATTVVVSQSNFLWPIPDAWTMEEAATVPVAYATAYYSLIIRGKLQRGEKVLIHSGSGAVGQAAIAICLDNECQLFITVGSEEKRALLMQRFPQLKPDQFASSRDIKFEKFVLQSTEGQGVDIVLNSLAEEKLQASVNCLAPYGRFLEIGKFDLSLNNPMNIAKIMENKTFHGILLDNLFNFDPRVPKVINRHRELIWELMREGIQKGVVRPLDRTIFSVDECEQAFRFMASGKHTGKVIICIKKEEEAFKPSDASVPYELKAIPRTVFFNHKSYIVTGGLGGFGLELVNWMIERDARNFVLTSRSGVKDLYQQTRLNYFKMRGAKVIVFTEDAATEEGAAKLVDTAQSLGPLGGIFHLAMVLSDGLFDNQTITSFESAVKPKADTFHNLDLVTRKKCDSIDYFVAFSSVSCGCGNPGQTNYGFANSVMERICEKRRKDNLHGFAIQWGAIGDVGYIIDNIRGNDIVICGSIPQRIPSCMATLDRLLQDDHAVCSNLIKMDFKLEFACGKTSLVKTVAHILGLKDYENLDMNLTLGELGMDSLMGVEVKQAIERDYDIVLSMQDLRKLTFGRIVEIQNGKAKSSDDAKKDSEAKAENSVDDILMPAKEVFYLNEIVNGDPILFLPQIDATWDLLKPLAQKLNRPAIGINWTKEYKDLKTVPETALHIIKILDDQMPNLEGNYDMVGYSFGGILAMEMGIQLAKRKAGRTKKYRKLILLDSSPKQFRLFIDETARKFNVSGEKNEHTFLEVMMMFLVTRLPINYNKIRNILAAMENDAERMEFVRDLFKQVQNVDIQKETLEFLINTHFNKMDMIKHYECAPKSFEGDLLLIRASELLVKSDELARPDYWLGEVITGECRVEILEGDHEKFVTNNLSQMAQTIHSYVG